MATPDPENPKPESQDALRALIEAFGKLPPLLSYGGLILVAAIIILRVGGVLPDILLAVPVIAIVAFLIYTYMDYDLRKRQQELDHAREIAHLGRTEPIVPEKPEQP